MLSLAAALVFAAAPLQDTAHVVLVSKNPLESVDNLESVEWVMRAGRIWRPGQLRSGIAMR